MSRACGTWPAAPSSHSEWTNRLLLSGVRLPTHVFPGDRQLENFSRAVQQGELDVTQVRTPDL